MPTVRERSPAESTLSKWRGILSRNRGELLFAIGTISGPVANMLAGVISARHLKPVELGVLNTAALFPAYLGFLQLGVFSGLSRNLPMEMGAGRSEAAWRLLRTSGAVATWVGAVGAAVCMGGALWNNARGNGELLTWALAMTGLWVFATTLATHVDTSLRGLHRFLPLSTITLGTSFITAASSALILWMGAAGAVVRILVCALGIFGLRVWSKVWSPKWNLEKAEALSLGRSGFPLMLSGAFFSFLSVADRSVIALMLGKADVGHFALAGLIVNSLAFVPQSISLVLFPKMARHYGANRSSRSLRRYLLMNLGFNLVTVVPISLVAYWGIDPLVHALFPKYVAGIPAAKIACLTCLCWIYFGVGSVIGIVNRMTPYLIAMVLDLAVIWGLGIYLVSHGHGIEGAAWARFAGTLFLCAFTLLYSWYLTSVDLKPAEAREASA